jgi:hypothetical protein
MSAEDLKRFKQTPVVEVRVEKQYIVSIAGKKVGEFRETGELCGMKQLTGKAGILVIDCPDQMGEILATIFASNERGEPFKAGIIKASPDLILKMKEITAAAKAEHEGENQEPEAEPEKETTRTLVPVEDGE